MASPSQDDLTPVSGSATDVAAVGQSVPPAHERTAGYEHSGVNWNGIAESAEFKALLKAKLRFIVPGTIFFMIYFMLLPVLVGYLPKFMSQPILGPLNLAYLFGLSQFFMSWVLAAIYVKVAAGWDRQAAALLAQRGH